MMNIRKYISVATMTGLLATALIGCTKTEEVYIDELYQKAYIGSDFYPQSESTPYVVTDAYTDPFLEVRNNSLIYSTGFLRTISSGSNEVSFHFRTIYPVKADLTASLVVAEDFLAEYNENLGLSGEEAYRLLPAGYYTVTQPASTILAGRSQGKEMFAITIHDDMEGLESGLYLIPFTVELDGPIELSSTMGHFCVPMKYSLEDQRTGEATDVPTNLKLLAANTDFTFVETTAKEDLYMGFLDYYYDTAFIANGLAGLFDNNSNSLSGSQVRNAKVNVTFNEPAFIDRISFANTDAYDMSTYQQKGFEVQISCLYEGETDFSEAVTVVCDNQTLYWFDAASKLAHKRIEQMSFRIIDEMTVCSDICFMAVAE